MTHLRIDTHCHLLPGVDDGCSSIAESLECVRTLVANGYGQAFCTPHIWTSYKLKTPADIRTAVDRLQESIDTAGIDFKVMPGGEHNLKDLTGYPEPSDLITFGLAGKYVLADLWVDEVPQHVWDHVKRITDSGLQLILGHPERMAAIQHDPSIADAFRDAGVLLQANLEMFSDAPHSLRRRTAETLLERNAYFMIGSDTHRPNTIGLRIQGLKDLESRLSPDTIDKLTIHNPLLLLA